MYFYKIYGLYIKSDYRLEEAMEVSEISTISADIEIIQGDIDERLTKETEIDEGLTTRIVYRYERNRGWIRVKSQGCFVMENGSTVTYQLKENYNPLMINQLLLCAAIPVLMIQRGEIALHGSGILWGERAIVISGVSGSGKSTLAAELLANGGIFMADDTVALQIGNDKIYAQGAYPQQKICTDAIKNVEELNAELILLPRDGGEEKYAVRLREGFCMERQELDALFVIEAVDVEQVNLREVTGSEKIKYVVNNLYKYGIYKELGMSVEVFKKCIQIANQIKIYVIARPKQGMTVTEQMAEIRKVLE